VGIGTNAAAAWAPYLTAIHGVKIAVIGVSQVAELASSWVATASRPGEANAIDLRRCDLRSPSCRLAVADAVSGTACGWRHAI
jgi:hypothetical protein